MFFSVLRQLYYFTTSQAVCQELFKFIFSYCLSLASRLLYNTICSFQCQVFFYFFLTFFDFILHKYLYIALQANGERGIWTLAPLSTTYSLSRGAPSASWVFLQNVRKIIYTNSAILSSIFFHFLIILHLSICFAIFCLFTILLISLHFFQKGTK